MKEKRYDIAVIGAGFAGSLTALGLDQLGYNVLLIEKEAHPRFAIGESSTPIADMILRDLAGRYDLSWLYSFSRYGSWQDHHPEVACGIKRGFSYYSHRRGRPFRTDEAHSRELLVAASVSNRQSDTNWYRPDLDAFLVSKVRETGIDYFDQTTVTSLLRTAGRWELEARREKDFQLFSSDWIIDATGSGALLHQLGIPSAGVDLRTRTSAIFSHFTGLKPWQSWLREHHISTGDYPYNPDFSALHHLLDEGWLWMLRFNNGTTSAGLVLEQYIRARLPENKQAAWKHVIGRYPSLADLFEKASVAELPGQLFSARRLQRRAQKVYGEGWVALPHTAGFVDPLHSTGIAHSLSGVERILYAFEEGGGSASSQPRSDFLATYERAVFRELRFIDLLVDGCYKTRRNFDLFTTYSMLYFTAAINYEQKRLRGLFDIENDAFLLANHPRIPALIHQCYREVQEISSRPDSEIPQEVIEKFRVRVKKEIAPFNPAGLLDPDIPNIYEHTAADLGCEK
ncbi:FADH2 O2-dependent halogenase [Fodinibius roseus]|uniref:FADH2 O2-dependent halogenase n=1 Tax=Fodinibius roseus TaxID=1194090 RepID=A0A1M4XW69_9BACT|nr:FAD-dependent oxidoreductase [Fodinibius roseus]SHE97502.1 FADH2 O2-dependent halogenase [Fodinibius roseus]